MEENTNCPYCEYPLRNLESEGCPDQWVCDNPECRCPDGRTTAYQEPHYMCWFRGKRRHVARTK